MRQTLKEQYEKQQEILTEGFLDYFKTGSANIQKFNSSIASLKKIAQSYNMKNLQNALTKAENDFQNIVISQQTGQKVDQTKAGAISQAVTFVSIMTNFMNVLKNVTSQLPSMQTALKDQSASQTPLKQLLGADVNKFGQLISAQFNKSGGGILSKIGRLFSGGGAQNPQAILQKFGINGNIMSQDILNLTPEQFNKFLQESASTPSFEVQTQTQPANAATRNNTPAPPVETTNPTQAQQTAKVQPPEPTQAASTTKPNNEQAQQRDVAIQKVVRNRNAFNSQILSQLDNVSVEKDLRNIANVLGIKL